MRALVMRGSGFHPTDAASSPREEAPPPDGEPAPAAPGGAPIRRGASPHLLGVIALILASASAIVARNGQAAEPPAAAPAPLAAPAATPTLLRWANQDGRVIEASFEGMDGPDHVLLRTEAGTLHRYPMSRLAPWSQQVARDGGKLHLTRWTNKAGQSIEAAFEGLEGPHHVRLRLGTGELHAYPLDSLSPESRQRIGGVDGPRPVSVLIIGDSLSLCGFGKRLDEKLRATPWVGAVATYMVCGTNPLSWLKSGPYAKVQTACGIWTIESVPGRDTPREVVDTYGTPDGHKPATHPVPKLENLLATAQPEVLIIQCGNNLFGLFEDRKTVQPEKHAQKIRTHMAPLMALLSSQPSPLRKVFWVTPPQTGSVSEDIQNFLFDQIRANAEPLATVIDSRKLIHYPYSKMGADKEHFWGPETGQWADRVYEQICAEAVAKPLHALPRLHEKAGLAGAQPPGGAPPAAPPSQPLVRIRAKLIAKTPFPEPGQFAPYQEYLVGYKYAVQEVLEGRYTDKEILVMHPAYVRLKRQEIERREIGRVYELRVRQLDATSLWNPIRRQDDTDSLDLQSYVLKEDEDRHPDARQETAGLVCPCATSS